MKQKLISSRALIALLSAGLVSATTLKSNADTILGDTFTQNPGSLASRPVEVPQAGAADSTWGIVNSSAGNLVVSGGVLAIGPNGSFAKAVAPFDSSLVTGSYTLSYTLSFNTGTNSGTTFYGGFGNGTGDGTSFADYSGAAMFSVLGDATGTSFTLSAGQGPVNTLSTTITRASTSVPYTMNLSIAIDPTTNMATYEVNNAVLGTISDGGQVGGLWFKEDQGGSTAFTGFDISSLSVTTPSTPEPSTFALMLGGLGLLGVALHARRRA